MADIHEDDLPTQIRALNDRLAAIEARLAEQDARIFKLIENMGRAIALLETFRNYAWMSTR